jgi:capsid protein
MAKGATKSKAVKARAHPGSGARSARPAAAGSTASASARGVIIPERVRSVGPISIPIHQDLRADSPLSVLRLRIRGQDQRPHDMSIVARRGSYRAANNPRTRLQTPYGGSGDQQADPWSRRICRELSRDMERNSDTYRTLLDTWTAAVIGDGVKALLRSSDEEWNKVVGKMLHAKMLEAGEGSIDARKSRSGYECQADFARAAALDGDAAIIKLSDLTIQIIEADQITSGTAAMSTGAGTLTYADGINQTAAGAPVSYIIYSYDQKTGAIDFGAGQEFPAEVVEFVAFKTRVSQTRGMPLIIAGIESWERLDSYKESEVIAAEQGSQIYGVIKHVAGNYGFGGVYSPQAMSTGNDAQPPTLGIQGGFSPYQPGNIDWHETNAGSVMELSNGDEYVPVNPQRPNKDAAPFLIEMLRQFTANGGLPYEFVYNDLRGLSWSVHRALVQMARDKIKVVQELKFAPRFKSLFTWILATWINAGVIPLVQGWDQMDLDFPQISWPDEGKEFEAQTVGLRSGLTTRHRLFGPDWRGMLDERMIELRYAADLVVQYNAEYPDFETTPNEFLGLLDAQSAQQQQQEEGVDGGDEVKAPGKTSKSGEDA